MLDFVVTGLKPNNYLTRLRQDTATQFLPLPDSDNLFLAYRSGEPNESALFDLLYDPVLMYVSEFISSEQDARRFANMIVMEFFTVEKNKLPFESIDELVNFLFSEVSTYCFANGDKIPETTFCFSQLDDFTTFKSTERLMAVGLYNAIESLPALRRKIMKLSILEKHSPEQISEKMQITVQSVKKHRLAAMRIIRARLCK